MKTIILLSLAIFCLLAFQETEATTSVAPSETSTASSIAPATTSVAASSSVMTTVTSSETPDTTPSSHATKEKSSFVMFSVVVASVFVFLMVFR